MGLLSWVLIGGLAGWVASLLVGEGGGIIFDIIVGILGALLGGFIMNRFGDAGVTGWNLRSFGVAVLGAVILLVILRLVRGRGGLSRRW
ncbi:MAG: GlsB/YeaQ/YmgE family stress response membrane protein [Actinobacteria bacterium]|nr:GlsB/YeaQ/YmgE family stress response membrane protein [Actinomycetota bacterium]